MTRISTLSGPTQLELQDMLRWWRQTPRGQVATVDAEQGGRAGRAVRWAKTTTSTAHPTYPTFPGNKFVVEFGEYLFDDTTTGDEEPVFTAYDPAWKRIASSEVGYLLENTVVIVEHFHGRWHVTDSRWQEHLVKADANIAAGASGTVSIWDDDALADTLANVTAYHDWMDGTNTFEATKEGLIRWFPRQRKYRVVELEC